MKKPILVFLLFSALTIQSCDPAGPEIADWGKTKSYPDFWWEDYTSEMMEQTLVLDFNDDAKKLFTGTAVFELVMKNGNGSFVPTKEIILYKNGERCIDNRMPIGKEDNEITVGIEIADRNMQEGCYTLFLNPVDNGGLDRIEQIELQNGFNVQKIDVMNPLAKKMIWSAIIIAAFFIAWIIVSRIVNPNLKFSRISFDYDGAGEVSHRVGNCYKIICTDKPKRISLMHRIFIGNVYVETNEFWNSELTVSCGYRDTIRLSTRGDYMLPDEPVRKESFQIQNGKQSKVNIETT